MTRTSATKTQATPATSKLPTRDAVATKALSKLDQVEGLLMGESGASIAEIMTATGWQQHSVRGAMAGALKKRGLTISSEKVNGVRRYRATRSEAAA